MDRTPELSNVQECICQPRRDGRLEGGECQDPFILRQVYWRGPAIHTIRGRSAYGCIAHDACCRSLPGACFWNVACHAIGVEALAECEVAGWPYSASYSGPHEEGYTTFDSAPDECSCENPCTHSEY